MQVSQAAPPLPDPATIRRTAEEVVARADYQIEPKTQYGFSLLDWIIWLLEWLATPLQWAFGLSRPVGIAITIVLLAILVALVAHIIYSFTVALREPSRSRKFQSATSVRYDPAAWEQKANEALGQRNYIGAVRCLFRAGLIRLEQAQNRVFRQGVTNREYLRRYQASPAGPALGQLVEVIDAKWYGPGTCRAEDYEACQAAYQQICQATREIAHAQRP